MRSTKHSPVDSAPTVSKADLLIGGNDTAFRHLVHDLLAFSARLEEVRNRFGAYIGLTGIQFTILISVRHLSRQGGAGVKAVADHLALSGAFVTIETTKLVKLGLLNKRPNDDDRRRVLLTVSDRGSALLDQLAPVQSEINDALFDSLDKKGFQQLAQFARNLREDSVKALLLADYLTQRGEDRS
jgi:MarR family transcriptional regulator, organic hydroperoxide resistance regulator